MGRATWRPRIAAEMSWPKAEAPSRRMSHSCRVSMAHSPCLAAHGTTSARAAKSPAGSRAHRLGDDADPIDAGAFRGVDYLDDVLVPQRAGAGDVHRLVPPVVVDGP